MIADKVNRHRTAVQILSDLRLHLGANRRQRAIGKHGVAVLLQVPPDRVTLILQLERGNRQVNGVARTSVRGLVD